MSNKAKPLDRKEILKYFAEAKEYYENESIGAEREYKIQILGAVSEINTFLAGLRSGLFDAEEKQ